MNALVIVAIVVGAPFLFVLALLFEIVCGQSPGQHYRRAQLMEQEVEDTKRCGGTP